MSNRIIWNYYAFKGYGGAEGLNINGPVNNRVSEKLYCNSKLL